MVSFFFVLFFFLLFSTKTDPIHHHIDAMRCRFSARLWRSKNDYCHLRAKYSAHILYVLRFLSNRIQEEKQTPYKGLIELAQAHIHTYVWVYVCVRIYSKSMPHSFRLFHSSSFFWFFPHIFAICSDLYAIGRENILWLLYIQVDVIFLLLFFFSLLSIVLAYLFAIFSNKCRCKCEWIYFFFFLLVFHLNRLEKGWNLYRFIVRSRLDTEKEKANIQ